MPRAGLRARPRMGVIGHEKGPAVTGPLGVGFPILGGVCLCRFAVIAHARRSGATQPGTARSPRP